MASKLAKVAMMAGPQQHTAGLFSDISVDGPEIGTLVVIVDRGRNLPNRKSMGKQDAYCAARLGKEAKKTETDRRGGQTPKWDQELRFTVHDGLDYHQLKVSVFSEDKRTDLVGECWIPLDSILTPGGGKNDLWQTLNHKGRYAGEIRVELTFYDSRPREIKQEEITAMRESQSNKNVKRRPLPADPTSTVAAPMQWHGPRPLPSTSSSTSSASNSRSLDTSRQESDTYQRSASIQNENSYDRPRSELGYTSQSDIGVNTNSRSPMSHYLALNDQQDEPDYNYNGSTLSAPATYGGIDLPELPPHTPRSQRSSNVITPKYYTPVNSSPTYTLPQYDRASEQHSSATQDRNGSSFPHRSDSYQSSPLRSYSTDDAMNIESHQYDDHLQRHHSAGEQQRYDEEFNSPPPPPRHSRGSSTPQTQANSQTYQPNYSPGPLNLRRPTSSNAASPLAREYKNQPSNYSVSPSDARFSSSMAISAPNTASHTPTGQRFDSQYDRRGSVDADSFRGQPSYAAASDRRPQSYNPQNNMARAHERMHQTSRSFDDGNEDARFPAQMSDHQQYAHREGAPIARPRAISPAARATMRKSVSPRPSTGADEPGLRGVAFSPDSFDQFNPNMGNSHPNSKLGTPDSIRVAQRAQPSPPKVENNTIIGSDGRVIDPSDHLPSDTWAPEPEKKSPRKSHQINVKYRHSPQSSQSRDNIGSSRPLPQISARPASMMPSASQPMTPQQQTYAADDTLSQTQNGSTGARNRLHKRPPSQANSAVNTPSPHQNRTPQSQPLRENSNYGYNNNNSPSYGRQSMSGPPPVPAKIPYGREQEDWHSPNQFYSQQQQQGGQTQYQNQNYQPQNNQRQSQPQYNQQQYPGGSLSDEMSRIDLDSGGRDRARRNPVRHGAY